MAALLALLAAVGWGSSDYAAGSASRRSSAVSVVILTHFAAVVALLVVAFDFEPVTAMLGDIWDAFRPDRPLLPVDTTQPVGWAAPAVGDGPKLDDVLWGLAAGLGGGFGAMLLFRGLGRGSMAVVAPITATGAAAIPALYGIATGESVTMPGVVGIGLALVAIVLVSVTGADDDGATSVTDACPSPATGWPSPPNGSVAVLPPPSAPVPPFASGKIPGVGVVAGAESEARSSVAVLPPPSGPVPPFASGMVPGVGVVADADSEVRPVVPQRERAGEIRMSLRRMRSTVVALTLATLLAAAVAAAGPIGTLVAGDSLATDDVVALGAAFVVVVAALAAVNAAKLLFQVQAARPAEDERRTDPPSFDGRVRRTERRIDASSFDLRSILRQPGLPEALLSGVGFGLFFVFISRASEAAGFWPLVGARTISVVMFAGAAVVTSAALLPERGSRRWVVLAGVLDAAAAVFFVLSTRAGLLSVGAVLASLYPIVTVLLARFVGGERIRRQQYVGLALAIGAVSLLAV